MIEKNSLEAASAKVSREAILMRCMALFLLLVVSTVPIRAQVRVWEGVVF